MSRNYQSSGGGYHDDRGYDHPRNHGNQDYNDRNQRKRSRSHSNSRERSKRRDRDYDNDRGYGNSNNNRWNQHQGDSSNQHHSASDNPRSQGQSQDYSEGDGAKGNGGNYRGHTSHFNSNQQQHSQQQQQQQYGPHNDPCTTVMVRGLSGQTTETMLQAVIGPYYPKDIRVIVKQDGECKGFAFVEFISLEYAQYFMAAFAGSTGDPNAAPLFIDNRIVNIEYARSNPNRSQGQGQGQGGHAVTAAGGGENSSLATDHYQPAMGGAGYHPPSFHGGGGLGGNNSIAGGSKRFLKSDWLCETCGCHNFAKRDICFRCNLQRTENAVVVTASSSLGDMFGDSLVSCDIPSTSLAVKGFVANITEDQIIELFRQFAIVKQVTILRDPSATAAASDGLLKGLVFVEFHSIEHANYALAQCSALFTAAATATSAATTNSELSSRVGQLKLAFAREMVMQQLILQYQQQQQQQQHQQTMPYGQKQYSLQHGNGRVPISAAATAAMQAAQWSMNNGYGAIAASLTAPAPTMMKPQHPFQQPIQQPLQQQQIWPQIFETHGGAYLFQPKTGYFLDPITEYYYCPKARLYYHAREGIYYQYDPSVAAGDGSQGAGCFKRYDPPLPMEADHSATTTAVTSAAGGEEQTTMEGGSGTGGGMKSTGGAVKITFNKKPAKSIKLTLASAGASAVSATAAVSSAASVVPVIGKKVLQDIAKWGAIQRAQDEAEAEEKEPADQSLSSGKRQQSKQQNNSNKSNAITASFTNVAMPLASSLTTAAAVGDSEPTTVPVPSPATVPAPVPTVAPSSFVCLLCRRQFTSQEILTRHEKESKLHAENLAKQQQEKLEKEKEQQAAAASKPVYRNRAEERRELFGSLPPDHHNHKQADPIINTASSSSSAATVFPAGTSFLPPPSSAVTATSITPMMLTAHQPPPVPAVAAAVSADEHNPGNQIMRKLGWKDGQGLGKDNDGREVALGVELTSQEAQATSMHSTIRGTIGGSHSGGGHGGGGGSAGGVNTYNREGHTYRESLLVAAKARYNQLEQQQQQQQQKKK